MEAGRKESGRTWTGEHAPFAPPPAALTLISPNGGEAWRRGTLHAIQWNLNGAVGTYVRLELWRNGVLNRVLSTASLATNRSFTWTVPYTQVTGTGYKIRITSVSSPAFRDESDSVFSIVP